jgi:hypothetical protein
MDRVQAIRLGNRLKKKRSQPDAVTIIWLKWKTRYLFKRIHQSQTAQEEYELVRSTGLRMKNLITLLRENMHKQNSPEVIAPPKTQSMTPCS